MHPPEEPALTDAELLKAIDDHPYPLNSKECEMLDSMMRWIEDGSPLTGPQRAWAERMLETQDGRAAEDEDD